MIPNQGRTRSEIDEKESEKASALDAKEIAPFHRALRRWMT